MTHNTHHMTHTTPHTMQTTSFITYTTSHTHVMQATVQLKGNLMHVGSYR